MARKSKIVTIPAGEGNRDAGKAFVLTEMSATRAEKWATRALMGVARAGVEVPEDFALAGMAGLAVVGLRGLLAMEFEEAEALLSEMFECVQIMPTPTDPRIVRPLIEDDLEEVSTILLLRSEVIELHTGFSIAAALSNLGAAMKTTLAPPDA